MHNIYIKKATHNFTYKMNTDNHLNTSFTFAPKVLIVQLQAGLLTIPPFDLPSHLIITVAM